MKYRGFFDFGIWRYLVAVLVVAIGVGLNLLLTQKVEPSAAPLLFAAVLIAAWQGGWGPGLVATALASLADDYFFIPPLRILSINVAVMVRLAVFLSVALLTSYLTSKREQALAAERSARLEAEEANRNKDRFLAVTSHELRTPLSVISMWSELISRQGTSDESAREGVAVIRQNIGVLKALIDDLLDVARIAAGKVSLHVHPLDISRPIQGAIEAIRPDAEKKQIKMETTIHAGQVLVNADEVRIRQIVSNLLTNAVKFTPPGGVIQVQLKRAGETAEILVRDSGCGISAEDLPRVFDRFWQAKDCGDANNKGLGLGLAIARQLVDLHGGHIEVQSDGIGCGTTFHIALPIFSEGAAFMIERKSTEIRQNVREAPRRNIA